MGINYRDFRWNDEDKEHSPGEEAEARALANKWSELHFIQEQRHFARQSDIEEGRDCGPEFDTPEEEAEHEDRQRVHRALERLEVELVEEKLAALGARMMRPYEHWNEDERYMEYMERDR